MVPAVATSCASAFTIAQVRLVAGDTESGFHRRAWQSRKIAEDTEEQRLEGIPGVG